jgi:uncharacterized protein (TIGR03663 family)
MPGSPATLPRVETTPIPPRARGVLTAAVLLAAALRFPGLALRPMHADEAVHADKFGTLLEGGGYAYDPSEYHGPTLAYMTLPSAWLRGERKYVEIDEVTLRAVPAALGVLLVAAHLGAGAFLGWPGAALAALLAAISPAMVFYSRDYIHETPLVFFSFGALLAACWYMRRPGTVPALLAGACVGMMLATKETAPLALLSMLLALGLTLLVDRAGERSVPDPPRSARGRDALLALLAAAVVSGLLFTSFLSRPRGLADSVRAYGLYLHRAGTASWHFHPWDYYLRLLVHFPAEGTPFWTEGLILVMAAVGGAAGWTRRGVPGADSRVLRFLGFYTLLMLAVYSAVPYKTPWCLLGFLQGMILLAGPGAVFLVRACRGVATKTLVCALLSSSAAQLGWQAWCGSFRFAADPRNPYVYAQTGTDVFEIVARLKDLAHAHPEGLSLPVQVVSRENLWPLPWYLRGFSRVAWWNGVSETTPSAPVILVSPDMEPALVRKLYDLPPPGERELYVGIFERPIFLRPGVELRGYATGTLWGEFRRLEAEAPRPPIPRDGLSPGPAGSSR